MNILKMTKEKNNLRSIEMAIKLGISKSYYSMLENGQRPLSKNVAFKLREQFGINLDLSLGVDVHGRETFAADDPNSAA